VDVRLPDGRILRGVPEGTTKDQIMAKLNKTEPTKAPEEPEGFSALEMLKNIPGSVGQLASDIVQPIVHPVDTAQAMGGLLRGGISKIAGFDDPAERSLEAVGDFYKERYCSVDKALSTLQEDPAGLLTDLSMGLGLAGKVGKSSKIVKAANAIDPTNAAVNTGLLAAKALPSGKAAQWYNEAAKIRATKRKPQGRVDKQVQTALDEQIMPTQKGLRKLNTIVDDLNDQIEVAIDASTGAGGTINKSALFKNLKDVRKRLGGIKMGAPADLKTVDRIIGEFSRYLDGIGANKLTARQLQDFKRSLYKEIDFDRSQLQAVRASEETKKAVARAAKEGVEQLVPDQNIAALNAREGRLLDLKGSLEPSASRIERRDAMGIGVPIKASAGQMIAGIPGAAAGLLSGMWDSPKFKARAALGLNRIGKTPAMDVATADRMFTRPRQGILEISQIMQEEERRKWLLQNPNVFNR